MRIRCECGFAIRDSTDFVAEKAHIIPDQSWEDAFVGMENVMSLLARGEIDQGQAKLRLLVEVLKRSMLAYQCHECGRLIICPEGARNDLQDQLFVPAISGA